jgi:salicylate hydroxylase
LISQEQAQAQQAFRFEMKSPMKIALVGGGIGGLATALAMTKAGLAVTVHERSEQLVDQGAGITLGPNATRVLYHLDIGAAARPG